VRLIRVVDDAVQRSSPYLAEHGLASLIEAEGRSNYHLMREGEALVADAYWGDMALAFTAGDRLVLLCGCCHAGLLGTLAHVQHTFERHIAIVAGGLHLTSATAEGLQHIGQVLMSRPALKRVYPNHCSGEAAFVALTQILGPSVVRPSRITHWRKNGSLRWVPQARIGC
jgi:metal-dependent hydrolase (beta-lactamase superfamily II)